MEQPSAVERKNIEDDGYVRRPLRGMRPKDKGRRETVLLARRHPGQWQTRSVRSVDEWFLGAC